MVGRSSKTDLQLALDHYGAMWAELERCRQVEAAQTLRRVAVLDRMVQREQAADAGLRRRLRCAPVSHPAIDYAGEVALGSLAAESRAGSHSVAWMR
jgi:hypothetical protein